MSGTIRPSSSMCAFHSANDRLELGRVVAALLEPNRVLRVERDAVLVPRDVPGDRHDDLGVDAREDDDRDRGLAERLADPADGAPVLRRVEEIGRLDHRELLLGQAAQDRLGRDRALEPARRGFSERPRARSLPPPALVGTVGTVGAPSRIQPCSSAVSWQSGQTSTYSVPPFGEKRIARSPISSVRSQIAHERSTVTRVIARHGAISVAR